MTQKSIRKMNKLMILVRVFLSTIFVLLTLISRILFFVPPMIIAIPIIVIKLAIRVANKWIDPITEFILYPLGKTKNEK